MVAKRLCLLLALLKMTAAVPAFEHNALDIAKRQDIRPVVPVMAAAATTPPTPLVYMYVTPSPGATPVPVTQQGQLVTSYVPQYTVCALPPVAAIPQPTPTPWPTTRPYRNYTASYQTGPNRCTTVFSETLTEVCATTLSGLVDRYTVTFCAQNITFSTQYGYILVTATPITNLTTPALTVPATITPAPSVTVRTLTSFFIASWQDLTSAAVPTDVDVRICSYQTNGTYLCVLEYQIWRPTVVTYVETTTSSINLTTTMVGPSQIIFETITANVSARLTTLSLIETAELVYSIESESTSIETRTPTITQTAPTSEVTYTVLPASSSSLPTRTTTVALTSTVFAGTTTLRRPSVTPVPEVDEEGGDDEGQFLPNPEMVNPRTSRTWDLTSILGQRKE
ncbi:Hypothetical protein D9617_27g045710 [Elsinoe fawcettii]|nr:Hypothetical protein D9617_27g045710 [Elsinoe fawcettii]